MACGRPPHATTCTPEWEYSEYPVRAAARTPSGITRSTRSTRSTPCDRAQACGSRTRKSFTNRRVPPLRTCKSPAECAGLPRVYLEYSGSESTRSAPSAWARNAARENLVVRQYMMYCECPVSTASTPVSTASTPVSTQSTPVQRARRMLENLADRQYVMFIFDKRSRDLYGRLIQQCV